MNDENKICSKIVKNIQREQDFMHYFCRSKKKIRTTPFLCSSSSVELYNLYSKYFEYQCSKY